MYEFMTPTLMYNFTLLGALAASFLCKLFFLGTCLWFYTQTNRYRAPLIFLIIFLTGTLITESSNIVGLLLRSIMQIKGSIPFYSFHCRLSWAFELSQYHALALFLEHLITKNIRLGALQIANFLANAAISGCFLYLAIFKYYVPASSSATLPFEIQLVQLVYIITPLFFIQTAYILYKRLKSGTVPAILLHQIRVTIAFIIPFVLINMLTMKYSYLASWIPFCSRDKWFFYALSAVISSYGLYILGKKMLGLRFLNMRSAVASKDTFSLLSRCADILENIKYATAVKELAHLTQTFFHSAYALPLSRTRLYIRNGSSQHDISHEAPVQDPLNSYFHVEKLLQENPELLEALRSHHILIKDEIQFTHYYHEDQRNAVILSFLNAINAAIFLPIYEGSKLIAYIIIDRDARPRHLFTNKERDEMLIFSTYISNMLIMLKSKTVEELRYERKQLSDELFHKHQEINQYKESIRSFLRAHKDRKMGIIFYKNRRFTIANEAGQDLIGFDLNAQEGHPLVQALRATARRVEDYKTAQSSFSHDAAGNKIVISGLTSPDHAIILLVHYPEVADLIKDQLTNLQDPSRWDYILYLETTQSGKIIDTLLPGRAEKILSYKIDLLATALSKKAALLMMADDDLFPTVEILHSISMRDTLHIMKLANPEITSEYALLLFGLNPLMGETTAPLLEKLDNGTLFIQNIELLSRSTQDLLAHMLAIGSFQKLKSNQTISTNVRIICSTKKDLRGLVEEGLFSPALYDELHETTLAMPSLHDLTDGEIAELAQGIAQNIAPSSTYQHLLTLSHKDTALLSADRPTSIRELKERVHDLLHEKSDKFAITELTTFDPAFNEPNPGIAHAIRLGKKALKDPQVMALLWGKFKNQNKIAQLLGVNRSSVNRRCHEYGLI